MTEPLIQLHEIVGETRHGIDYEELRERYTVVLDWAGRECLTVDDAAEAYAIGRPRMKRVAGPGETERWERTG